MDYSGDFSDWDVKYGQRTTLEDGTYRWEVGRQPGMAFTEVRPDGAYVTRLDGEVSGFLDTRDPMDLDTLPAIMHQDGTREWWENGQLHQLGLPAIIRPDGSWEFWFRGQLHRKGLPAVRRPNGDLEWWVKGNNMGQPLGAFTYELESFTDSGTHY